MMDILDVCRLCGCVEEIKINIFEPGSEYLHYIHCLLPITIKENDNLPKNLCYRCAFQLSEFYKFREHCIHTDILLNDNEEFCPPASSEEKCVEKLYGDGVFSQITEQFDVKQPILRSGAGKVEEIITIDSRSPSPASDFHSTPQSIVIMRPTSNCNSTPEAEKTNVQACKRKKTDKCRVFVNIPDENANINETSVVDDGCCSLNMKRSKSKDSLVIGKCVKHSGNNRLCTDFVTETGQVTNLNEAPVSEGSQTELSTKCVKHSENNTLCMASVNGTGQVTNLDETPVAEGSQTELSPKCAVKGISNVTEISVQQTVEKNNITSHKQNTYLHENIIVTKIPGLYNVYTCSHCERTFITRESAIAHDCDVQPTQSDKMSYKCEICSKVFSRQATLLTHQKHHFSSSSDDE